jgi:flagellar basal-body rod modification protein FlgD
MSSDGLLWSPVKNMSVEDTWASTTRKASSELDKDAFLRLLLTELKYQDPLNPTDDKAFIAQMAQFSALEQMQNMSKAMSLTQGCSLIGRQIIAQTKEKAVSGVAEAVVIRNGSPYIRTSEDEVPMESVMEISSVE